LRRNDVDHPRALVLDRRIKAVERQLLFGVKRGEIVEIGAQPHRVRIIEIDLGKAGERKIAFAIARGADFAFDGITRPQAPFAHLIGGDVDIVRPGEVIRLGRAQEGKAVLQHLDRADAHDLFVIFLILGQFAQDAEQQILTTHGRGAFNAQFFGHRDQFGWGFSFEVFEMHSDFPKAGVAGWSVPPQGEGVLLCAAMASKTGLGESRPDGAGIAPVTGKVKAK